MFSHPSKERKGELFQCTCLAIRVDLIRYSLLLHSCCFPLSYSLARNMRVLSFHRRWGHSCRPPHLKDTGKRKTGERMKREREREREVERRSIRKVWRCSERRLERSFLPSLSLWSLVWITGGPAAKLIWNLQLLNSRSLPFTKVCLYFLFLGVNLFLNAELYFIYLWSLIW